MFGLFHGATLDSWAVAFFHEVNTSAGELDYGLQNQEVPQAMDCFRSMFHRVSALGTRPCPRRPVTMDFGSRLPPR